MHFDISVRDTKQIKEVIRFLNTSAKRIYIGDNDYLDHTFLQDFKSIILSSLNVIERTNRGVFGCDIFLKTARAPMLINMYPTLCDIFNIEKDSDIKRLGSFLDTFRNINAHSKLSEDDIRFFDKLTIDFKYYHYFFDVIKMVTKDGKVTIAGLLFVILNMLRQESLENIMKASRLFGLLILEKGESVKKGSRFVSKISKVNLECDIREKIGSNVIDAIVGDYDAYTDKELNSFHIRIGGIHFATYEVTGEYTNGSLTIKKGSISNVYYKDDFTLKIDEEAAFISKCNQLPTMIFIDYLYKKGISEYNKEIIKKLENVEEDINKLNHPKFYVDKNIDILLLPKNISDYRLVSSILGDLLSRIFILLETYIYKNYPVINRNGFSSIGNALTSIQMPSKLVKEIKYLRNFSAHGYLMNEYIVYEHESRCFSLDYIIQAFKNTLNYFNDNNKDIYEYFVSLVDNLFVLTLIRSKYKILGAFTITIFQTYPSYDKLELTKKIKFINHSMYEDDIFLEICSLKRMASKLCLPKIDGYLAVLHNKKYEKLLNEFLSNHNLKIEREENSESIVSTLFIK